MRMTLTNFFLFKNVGFNFIDHILNFELSVSMLDISNFKLLDIDHEYKMVARFDTKGCLTDSDAATRLY